MSSCELRPHHALCVGFFRGKGYSEGFVENMSAFIGTLRASDPLLTLRWSELSARAREHILSPGRLGEVCGDCQWYEICSQATVE